MRLITVGSHDFINTDTGEIKEATGVHDSSTDKIYPVSMLPALVCVKDGGILAGCHLYRYVAPLQEQFAKWDGWTCQIKAHRREVLRGGERIAIGTFLPVRFGFRGSTKSGGSWAKDRKTSRVFDCMDFADLVGIQSVALREAIEYAESIHNLCVARGIKFTGGRGTLAARLLKASPEWKRGRKAAPEFINEIARKRLPGNYYGLGTSPSEMHAQAIYVDQVSAHHAIAASTPVPHPDYLRARGNHRLIEQGVNRPWIRDRESIDRIFTQYGMVAAMVTVHHVPKAKRHLYPPFMHEPGRKLVYLYTNEREYFDSDKLTLEWLCAAWTSPLPDPAVSEYGGWAFEHRRKGPGRKPLLLAAYGALALRTDRESVTYWSAHRRGRPSTLPAAGRMMEVARRRKPGQPQPTIVNVLARGIIEAETRLRSLRLARDLDSRNLRVLSVYVDGLIVETDTMPLLPAGWTVEAGLTNLRFHHPNAFVSDQVRKMPGVPRGRASSVESATRMMLAARGRARSVRPAC